MKHLGVGTTLNALRLGFFWVPKGRQVVKKVLSHFMICRKMNGLPFKYLKVTSLHKHRVNLIVILELTLLAIYELKTMGKGATCTYLFLLV